MNEYSYNKDGFEAVEYLKNDEFDYIKSNLVEWIRSIYFENSIVLKNEKDIINYHINDKITDEIHNKSLNVKNRHKII